MIWKAPARDICYVERYLANNGVVNLADMRERAYWKDCHKAYEDAIQRTATKHAPWYVIPADHKWFTRIVVAAAVIDALASLDLEYPPMTPERRRELATGRKELLGS